MSSPSQHCLLALPTKAEVDVQLQTIEAFIADVPTGAANKILKTVDAAIHESNFIDLRHLRRFIKRDRLPLHLKYPTRELTDINQERVLPGDIVAEPIDPHDGEPRLHFLICATSTLSYETLRRLLLSISPFVDGDLNPNLRTIAVPLFPPTSEHQAKQLSQEYWPTAYKGGNPFGPHPAIVARATAEIEGKLEDFMSLASRAGLATSAIGIGHSVGAVVVNRTKEKGPVILAIAGDARWHAITEQSRHGNANAMAHSVMRVIGMVARKHRSLSVNQHPISQNARAVEFFADGPLTSLEKDLYMESQVPASGYLCLDLELYVTHEPCVMCCMAINHSRFGRVIFGKRMPTGGLGTQEKTCDNSRVRYSTYGLWWRHELNWKFLTWQWGGNDDLTLAAELQSIHA